MAAPRKLESSRSFVGQGLRNRFTRPGLPAAGALGLSRARLVPALAEPLQGLWHLFGPISGLLSWLIERRLGIAGNKEPAPRPVLHWFRAWWESPEKRPRNYWILPLCGFLSCPQICSKTKGPPFFRLLFDQLQASQSDQLHTDPTSARRRKATIFTASRAKTNNSSAPGTRHPAPGTRQPMALLADDAQPRRPLRPERHTGASGSGSRCPGSSSGGPAVARSVASG